MIFLHLAIVIFTTAIIDASSKLSFSYPAKNQQIFIGAQSDSLEFQLYNPPSSKESPLLNLQTAKVGLFPVTTFSWLFTPRPIQELELPVSGLMNDERIAFPVDPSKLKSGKYYVFRLFTNGGFMNSRKYLAKSSQFKVTIAGKHHRKGGIITAVDLQPQFNAIMGGQNQLIASFVLSEPLKKARSVKLQLLNAENGEQVGKEVETSLEPSNEESLPITVRMDMPEQAGKYVLAVYMRRPLRFYRYKKVFVSEPQEILDVNNLESSFDEEPSFAVNEEDPLPEQEEVEEVEEESEAQQDDEDNSIVDELNDDPLPEEEEVEEESEDQQDDEDNSIVDEQELTDSIDQEADEESVSDYGNEFQRAYEGYYENELQETDEPEDVETQREKLLAEAHGSENGISSFPISLKPTVPLTFSEFGDLDSKNYWDDVSAYDRYKKPMVL